MWASWRVLQQHCHTTGRTERSRCSPSSSPGSDEGIQTASTGCVSGLIDSTGSTRATGATSQHDTFAPTCQGTFGEGCTTTTSRGNPAVLNLDEFGLDRRRTQNQEVSSDRVIFRLMVGPFVNGCTFAERGKSGQACCRNPTAACPRGRSRCLGASNIFRGE